MNEQPLPADLPALIAQALAEASRGPSNVLDAIRAMIARLDTQLSAQLNEVLHAEEFLRLEGAWRGLHYLVRNSPTDATLKIRILNVGKRELQDDLQAHRWDRSALFAAVHEREFGRLGGEPYGALIADYQFGHSPADVSLLRDLSQVASAALCPLIAGADPALLGLESWANLRNAPDLAKRTAAPDYAAWNRLRDQPESRYVALCLPRLLARAPYGAKTQPVEAFGFEEDTDGRTNEKFCWMNAAYAMGANIARAFCDYGFTVEIAGIMSGGEVIDAPWRTFPADDGDLDPLSPVEIAIGDRTEGELSRLGLITICRRKGKEKSAFLRAQSLYRPQPGASPLGTAADNLMGRLPYMFPVSRFAHYLKCIARDEFGSTAEALQARLNVWLARYVDHDPLRSNGETMALRPLKGARVTLSEEAGGFEVDFRLRPHYQLDSVDCDLGRTFRVAGRVVG